MTVVRRVRDKAGRVQRRHIKHLKRFNARYMRVGKHYELADYREAMIDAFRKFAGDRMGTKQAIRGFGDWKHDAIAGLESASYNVESDGTIQITDGYKVGHGNRYRLKLRYNPQQRQLDVYMRGKLL